MRIIDLFDKKAIMLKADVTAKPQMLDTLVNAHKEVGNVASAALFKDDIMKREFEGPTAIAHGICMPHAKSTTVVKPGIAAMTIPSGIECGALDGADSNLFFMIAAPVNGADLHLEAVSRLASILRNPIFRAQLVQASDVDTFLAIIDAQEKEVYGDTELETEVSKDEARYRILGVTACTTGIAYTYVAADALEKAGNKMGVTIKVERDGAAGVKNELTQEEIANCDGVIIAADKDMDISRFMGKKILMVKIMDAVYKPEKLIKEILK